LAGTRWRAPPDHISIKELIPSGRTKDLILAVGVTSQEHANVFKPGDHASTFGGNPLACAAGLAVARALDEDRILENVHARGEQLRAGLKVRGGAPS
jgi:4-aminobutyrate aminotransferase-like enzyme